MTEPTQGSPMTWAEALALKPGDSVWMEVWDGMGEHTYCRWDTQFWLSEFDRHGDPIFRGLPLDHPDHRRALHIEVPWSLEYDKTGNCRTEDGEWIWALFHLDNDSEDAP